MTAPEILVVLVGLLVGWAAVYYLLGSLRRERGRDDLLTKLAAMAAREWPVILDVSPEASQEAIRLAYERRLDELLAAAPRVMTEQEKAKIQAARASLERAYAEATSQSSE